MRQMLISVDTRLLQLTPIDDDIYYKFRLDFPDVAISIITENTMKSEDAKIVGIAVITDCSCLSVVRLPVA